MNDVNDVRPSSISDIVGQISVRNQVQVAVRAAHQDQRKFDHSLLVGSPGLGKTQVAQVIAREMGTPFRELLGQSIKSVADLQSVLLAATDREILFIDEAHELDKSIQTALYLALDKRTVLIQSSRQRSVPMAVPIADFTLLLASTDEYQLLQPLRDRMRLVLRFDFYSIEDLCAILRQRLTLLGWEFEEDILALIAGRSRGTPRLALRLAQSARRVARSEGSSRMVTEHLERACELEGVDAQGLDMVEQRYLQIVSKGPTRLNVIASCLGLPTRTVAEVVEPYLVRAGMIEKDDDGRRYALVISDHKETSP